MHIGTGSGTRGMNRTMQGMNADKDLEQNRPLALAHAVASREFRRYAWEGTKEDIVVENSELLSKKRSLDVEMELGENEMSATKKSKVVDLMDGNLEKFVDEAGLAD